MNRQKGSFNIGGIMMLGIGMVFLAIGFIFLPISTTAIPSATQQKPGSTAGARCGDSRRTAGQSGSAGPGAKRDRKSVV